MPVPDIVDLDPGSDTRCRDVYARHHNRIMNRSGNLIRTTYYHVSGAQTNVAATEIVSLDSSENAQYDLLLRDPTAPLALANLTSANINTWSASSLLSLRQGTTTIRSANVMVGNLTTTSLNVAPGVSNKLDNFVVQSFQKTLVATAGAATEICTITQAHGIYTADLDVIQSVSTGTNISRSYKFVSWYNATTNAWRRLVPLASTAINTSQWGVEIRVNNDVTTLRLVRLSGSVTSGIECVLKLSQSRLFPVAIANSTVTEVGGTVTFSTTVHDNSVISQVVGRVGIGTDNPTQTLTVAGSANVQSLIVTGDATFDTNTLRVDAANNRVQIVDLTTTGNALFTSLNVGGVTAVNVVTANVISTSSLSVMGDATFDTNVLRVDAANNRVGIVQAAPAYTLDVTGDINASTGNVLRIGGTEVLSGATLGSGVTTSSLTTVGTLGNISVNTAGTATLGSTVIRTFQKSLVQQTGNVSEICSITGSNLTFAGDLHVVQAATSKVCRSYRICVSAQNGVGGTTNSAWQRLIPSASISTPSGALDGVAVEIYVDTAVNGECKLRLARVATAGTSSGIECVLVLQQSRANPVTITESTVTASGQTLATAFFKNTLLTQVDGNVGIGTDSPTDLLTVAGTANVQALIVAGTVSGTGVTQSVTNGSNALVTSNGVYRYVQTTIGGNLDLTSVNTGNVTANNLFMNADAISKLDNCIVRSFRRTLPALSGNTAHICTISNANGVFAAELNVVMSSTVYIIHSKTYKFNAYNNATSNTWNFLMPLTTTASSTIPLFATEIRVNGTTTTLRLVRTSTLANNETTNMECTLTVYQSRDHPVTITGLSATDTGVTPSTTIFENTLISQVQGRVGIGTDVPTQPLTVRGNVDISGNVASSGRTNTASLYVVGGNTYVFNSASLLQGSYINWNTNLGSGSVDFINKSGVGTTGGFNFYNHAGSGTATPIDTSTLIMSVNASRADMPNDVFTANASNVFTSTAGNKCYYRQLQQPCIFRGTLVFTPANTTTGSYQHTITGGPYVSDLLSCVVSACNGDYGANSGFTIRDSCIDNLAGSGQPVTKLRIQYSCNNTNPARVNFMIFFTPM
jgi:hypothetical protein